MFVGHYAPALALKRSSVRLPLWALFLGVQLVDIVWAILVIAGVEHVRVTPGFTALSPLDLYHMPYTHSLIPATVAWSTVAGLLAAALWSKGGWRGAFLIMAAAVASHWLLDLLVHAPDLPLLGDTHKVGLGLWNHPMVAVPLELGLLTLGTLLYVRATTPNGPVGRILPWVVLALLAAVYWISLVMPHPPSSQAFAVNALASYAVLAALAAWLDRVRT